MRESLNAHSLGFAYGRRDPVFDEVDVTLRPGVTGLVGVNGAGKTTLLRCLATDLRPTRGAVVAGPASWPGTDARTLRRMRGLIGYCPQEAALPRDVTVRQFLSYVGWLRDVPRRARAEGVERALRAVDLEQRAGSGHCRAGCGDVCSSRRRSSTSPSPC